MLRSISGSRVDDDQLAELYAAHRLSLVRLAVLLVDDLASAEDVVQDAFAAFAARGGRLREPGSRLRLPAYLGGQRLPIGAAPPAYRARPTRRRARSSRTVPTPGPC